jgi:1-deoxy-D-xylulose-5-phosphate reductoisomerase
VRRIAVLGSTGSIGRAALEVVDAVPGLQVTALAAGRNVEQLAEQVRRFRPALVSVSEPGLQERLREMIDEPAPEVMCGDEGARAVATHDVDLVLCAMVGAVGLEPTLAALGRPVTVAVANKEPLVMAGALCMERARQSGATLIPVDSEHSAIFQALRGHDPNDVRRLLLTGSGGPFRGARELETVTLEQALAHPTWTMGRKISIDSATLMNKGLEVIEAHWLFGVPAERIDVLIHPQSVVHSLVELQDGSMLAQLGLPDMRIAIAYALTYPRRAALPFPSLDLSRVGPLTFEPPDMERFPCLALAYQALQKGGTCPAVLNAANEVAVAAFLEGRIPFTAIPGVIERTLAAHRSLDSSLENVLAADAWSRQVAAAGLPGFVGR